MSVLLATAVTALLVGTVLGPLEEARADTASDLSAARQKAAEAQAAANATAAEFSAAEGRYEDLGVRIAALEARIEETRQRAAVLQGLVRDRAVFAYTHAGAQGLGLIFSSDPSEIGRRQKLVDAVNAQDNRVVDELAALRSDLRSQHDDVKRQREQARQVRDQLDAQNRVLQAQLAAAAEARDVLIARLEREQAAAAAAELARLKAAKAGAAPAGGGAPGQIITNPGGGSFQCPINGAAYSNNYGPRGSGFHYGIDMFAGSGTPEVAVKAGSVSYVANEGAGGNVAYLYANDGNVYYYAHMSSFVGGARSVAQGEIIGLEGSTGNSSAPHLHFEIRLGGANGQRINPYPTLQSAGC